MRILIFSSIFFLLIGFTTSVSCQTAKVISKVTSLTNKAGAKIFIKDKSKYSKVFIDELTATKYPDSIKVIDNYIIYGKNKTNFPNDLTINKDYIFKATKDNQSYLLKVKRINETTLKFDFNLYKKDKLVFTDKGEVDLGASFVLATEIDIDDHAVGGSYSSYEYLKELNGCWFYIRIGIGKDEKNNQRAKVIFGCNDKSKMKLNLDYCPILRTE